jgi:magnesium transporter
VLTIYRDHDGSIRNNSAKTLPKDVFWIDLLNPIEDETAFVEGRTGLRVPSMAALSEIETSSRLILDHGVMYLSTTLVSLADKHDPVLTPVGFVLSEKLLVTVRFAELPSFQFVAKQVDGDDSIRSSAGVFTTLLEAIVDRGADVLEHLGADLDLISKAVFRGDPSKPHRTARTNKALRRTLATIGRIGDRLSQARAVFLGIDRMVPFVLGFKDPWVVPEFERRLGAVAKDVTSLNAYEDYLSNKVQFLLDSVLGFINIEQNDLFKILTIVSVVGIPPTVVVGIYGMNFKFMPELNWTLGYPFGLAMVVLSVLLPLAWFKWRGWF